MRPFRQTHRAVPKPGQLKPDAFGLHHERFFWSIGAARLSKFVSLNVYTRLRLLENGGS